MRKIGISFSVLTDERMEKIRRATDGFEIIDISGDVAPGEIAECEIIFGNIPPEKMKAAKNLKWMHAQAAGVDTFLRPEYGFPEGVVLTNSSGAYGVGISEHLVTVTMMLLRNMNAYARLQAANTWKDLGPVKTIYERRVTVVGLGDIGGCYALRCHALGAVVSGVVRTPRKTKPYYIAELFTTDRIDDALTGADIVALCLPGTSETKNILSEERMLRMKKGAIILNIGRGTAIDQGALARLLESSHIGGAGLDVADPEPLPADSPLWAMPNVVITPHVSGNNSLDLTLDRIIDRFIKYLGDYAAGRPFERTVDMKAGY